jgi:hypothetical protein
MAEENRNKNLATIATNRICVAEILNKSYNFMDTSQWQLVTGDDYKNYTTNITDS